MQPSTRVFFQSIRPRQDPHHTLASGNKRCPSTSSEGSGRLRILGGKARFWPMTVRERHARVKVQSRYGTNLHNCVTAIPYSLVYSRCWREISRLPVATLVLGHDRRNKKAGIDGASARTSHLRASDRTSTGFLRDRSSFTSFTRRDQRTGRKRSERNTRADGRTNDASTRHTDSTPQRPLLCPSLSIFIPCRLETCPQHPYIPLFSLISHLSSLSHRRGSDLVSGILSVAAMRP